MPKSPKPTVVWSIQLCPTTTLVETAHLMSQLGCRCEFREGEPFLVPDNAQTACPTGLEIARLLTGGKHHPASKGDRASLSFAFEEFGLCLRVKAIHGAYAK